MSEGKQKGKEKRRSKGEEQQVTKAKRAIKRNLRCGTRKVSYLRFQSLSILNKRPPSCQSKDFVLSFLLLVERPSINFLEALVTRGHEQP